MENGTFEYILTLPTSKTENVEVKASEDGQTFVTLGGVTAQTDTLTITGLNHFTLFVTTATGGGSISSDTTGGSYTSLTGPVLTEGAAGDIGTGTIILAIPTGFTFNTATNNVTATVGEATTGSCSNTGGGNTPTQLGTGNGSSFEIVTPTTTSITVNVKTKSKNNICRITFSGIQVRPSTGTPLASGNITFSGTATLNGATSNSTNLGTLSETAGAVSASQSTVSASSSSAAADSSETSTITVTLKDASGNPVSGKTVTLAKTSGPGTPTITTISGITNASGTATFTVKSTTAGSDVFSATDTTDSNLAITQTASVNFTNVAPVASNQSVSTDEDSTKAINLSATDVNGDTLTYTIVSNPSNGVLSGTYPNVTYTPNANYNGSDSFTFKANDGTSDSNTATVSITVNSINDPPSFDVISNQSVNEDASSQNVSITNVSPGPSDESTQSVSMSATSSNTSVVPNPTISGSGSTRTLSYTPTANANGTVTITVTANDGQSQNNTFSRTFTITVNAVNDPPAISVTAPMEDKALKAAAYKISPGQLLIQTPIR